MHYRSMPGPMEGECMHPKNIVIIKTHKDKRIGLLKTPRELNKDNDCRWFHDPINPTFIERILMFILKVFKK